MLQLVRNPIELCSKLVVSWLALRLAQGKRVVSARLFCSKTRRPSPPAALYLCAASLSASPLSYIYFFHGYFDASIDWWFLDWGRFFWAFIRAYRLYSPQSVWRGLMIYSCTPSAVQLSISLHTAVQALVSWFLQCIYQWRMMRIDWIELRR